MQCPAVGSWTNSRLKSGDIQCSSSSGCVSKEHLLLVALGIPAHTRGYRLAARGSARYHEPDVSSTVVRPAAQSRDLVTGASNQQEQLSEDSLLALGNHAERGATTLWVWAGWMWDACHFVSAGTGQ